MELEEIRYFREIMRRLQLNLSWQSKSDAACCGITMAQCHVLMEIGKVNEISTVDLASILGLDKSTLSRTIDGMVETGLVERIPNPGDRRYIKLTLTKEGKKLFDSINYTFDKYYQDVFASIPPDKHQQVTESLSMLASAIAEKSSSECCREELTS